MIDGGEGTDTAVFSGNRADYTITEDNVNGLLIVTDNNLADGNDGTDTLKSINRLQFTDQVVTPVIPGITLIGTDTADNLAGGEGADTLSGGGGNDSLSGLDAADQLDGGAGEDIIDGGSGDDNLLGGDDSDTLTGGDGNDTVNGGNGDDIIVGGNGAGDDRYVGGVGVDTVKYSSATATIVVSLAAGTAVGSNIGSDLLFSIENIIGGQTGDSLTGNANANRIDGGTGNDTMAGLSGNDTYVVNSLQDVVNEQAAEGTDTVITTVSGIVLADHVENLTLSGAAITGTGNTLDNILLGTSGANTLNGADGNDTMDGGAGQDILVGGFGNDVYIVDRSTDDIVELAGGGTADQAKVSVSFTLGNGRRY